MSCRIFDVIGGGIHLTTVNHHNSQLATLLNQNLMKEASARDEAAAL